MKKFGTAVILCGGKSSRMGFDKCRITIGKKHIYEHIAEKLEEVFDEILLVTSKNNKLSNSKYRIVEDIVEECGPIGGIYTGLHYASSDYAFFTACDMPFVDIDLINHIMLELSENGCVGSVARNGEFIEPLHSFYSKALYDSIKSYIEAGNYQMNKLVKCSNIHYIEESRWNDGKTPNIFSNLNYMKDLDIIKDLYGDEVAFDE